MKNMIQNIKASIKKNFRFGTLSFLFIFIYINVFQLLFGQENSIVGVIFAIMMTASMARDLTGAPVRHFMVQTIVLVWMGLSAFLITILPMIPSIMVNFMTLALILYAYTYEYSQHLYFPYILSYLFLIFLAPIDTGELPKRLAAMIFGAVSILLYQWIMGRNRLAKTSHDLLSNMMEVILRQVRMQRVYEMDHMDDSALHKSLSQLIAAVYDRRKKMLCISDASFSMIDVGRGLESLSLSLRQYADELAKEHPEFLIEAETRLKDFQRFLKQEAVDIPEIDESRYQDIPSVAVLNHQFLYIRDRLLHMSEAKHRVRYQKTGITFWNELQIAINYSPVRMIYALRTACLLALAMQAVWTMNLPHGKWLLFTLASLSLPYADDIPQKIKKRFYATLYGGLISLLIYTVIPSMTGRTIAMILSGYLSFYFSDYRDTFICSTIGALGSAVFLNVYGVAAVGYFVAVRFAYIAVGIIIAYIINCKIAPYTREKATRQLWKKYHRIVEQLSEYCTLPHVDTQLYYSLVIHAFMLEAKLKENTTESDWLQSQPFLKHSQHKIRHAHRRFIEGRIEAPSYEAS